MPTIIINIGISARPDSRGVGHDWDTSAINAARQLFSQPVRLGAEMFDIQVNPQPVPRGLTAKSVADMGEVQQARQHTLTNKFNDVFTPSAFLSQTDLTGIDMVYIPGAASATPGQVGNTYKMQHATGTKGQESSSRDAFERELITKALDRGIPVFAVCAGSWRLIESFGGQVRELTSDEVRNHHRFAGLSKTEEKRLKKDNETVWSLRAPISISRTARGVVRASGELAAQRALQDVTADIVFGNLNSTHWAVADSDGGLLVEGAGPPRINLARARKADPDGTEESALLHRDMHRDPNQLLEIVATDPNTNTVEAFESQHGVPVVGAQWHPEGYLDGMPESAAKPDGDSTMTMSQEIFRNLILAAAASKIRRAGVAQTLEAMFRDAAIRPVESLGHVKDEEKKHRPGYYVAREI